jgi:dihydropteroate synthase
VNFVNFKTKSMIINCNGKVLDLTSPKIMGILNVTPDSFFDGGRYQHSEQASDQAKRMIEEGADIIDIGGMSSRPGAEVLSAKEEIQRVLPVIHELAKKFPQTILSIDTIHGETVKAAYEAGVDLVNDISAGRFSDTLIDTVAALQLPYILMHMQGHPESMQDNPSYQDVVVEVQKYLKNTIRSLRNKGIKDIIIDPGFGFGKRIEDNYQLLKHLDSFHWLECPVLVGISRKSMIYKVLGNTPEDSLNGSSALHMLALEKGAKLLRVHDVKEANEVVQLHKKLH